MSYHEKAIRLAFIALFSVVSAMTADRASAQTSVPDPVEAERLGTLLEAFWQTSVSSVLLDALPAGAHGSPVLMAGQTTRLGLVVRNPTATDLTILDPEDENAGGLAIWGVKDLALPFPDSHDHLGSGHEREPGVVRSRVLAAGQQISVAYEIGETPPNWRARWVDATGPPFAAGLYSVVYNGGKTSDFEVVSPKLVAVGEIDLRKTSVDDAGESYQAFTYCAALEYNNRSYVAIIIDDHEGPEPIQSGIGQVLNSDSAPRLGAYRVVSGQAQAISAISGTSDTLGRITILVTFGDGSQSTVLLDENRKLMNPTPPPAPTLGISPVLECVKNNGNGTFNARFGYLNRNSTVVTVPVGTNNRFSPNPQDRGQVAAFQPGRIVGAFEVTWPGTGNLVWSLKGPDNQNRTATASSTSQACAP